MWVFRPSMYSLDPRDKTNAISVIACGKQHDPLSTKPHHDENESDDKRYSQIHHGPDIEVRSVDDDVDGIASDPLREPGDKWGEKITVDRYQVNG